MLDIEDMRELHEEIMEGLRVVITDELPEDAWTFFDPNINMPDFSAMLQAEISGALGLPAGAIDNPDPSNASLVRQLDNRYSQTWLCLYPARGSFVIPLAIYELRHCKWANITYGLTAPSYPFVDQDDN